MQDRHLCCPLYFFLGPAVPPHFFHSRIATDNSPGAESPWARRLTARGVEKAQHCHKCFLQYSTFASERPQVRTWGHQTCLLSRAPSNLVTSLAKGAKREVQENIHTIFNF